MSSMARVTSEQSGKNISRLQSKTFNSQHRVLTWDGACVRLVYLVKGVVRVLLGAGKREAYL